MHFIPCNFQPLLVTTLHPTDDMYNEYTVSRIRLQTKSQDVETGLNIK